MRTLAHRLVASHLLLVALTLVVSGYLTYRNFHQQLVIAELSRAVVAASDVSRSGTWTDGDDLARVVSASLPPGVRARFVDASTIVRRVEDETGNVHLSLNDAQHLFLSRQIILDPDFPDANTLWIVPPWRFLGDDRRSVLVSAPHGEPLGVLELTADLGFGESLHYLKGTLLGTGLVALVVVTGLAYLVAGTLTRPLRSLTEATRRAASGDFSVHVDGGGTLETEELAAQFNEMARTTQGSLQQLHQNEENLRNFIADSAHQLKTPVSALIAFSDLLQQHSVRGASVRQNPERINDLVHEIRAQTEDVNRLVQGLLDLSRLGSGAKCLHAGRHDLRESVAAAVETLSPLALLNGQHLVCTMPDAPVVVLHDPFRVEQMVANVLDNGIKYAGSGASIRVSIEGNAEEARIIVADNGVGFSGTEAARAFDRFFRGPRTQAIPGSGLGLAIVKAGMDAHGGDVYLRSEHGKGARIELRFPGSS